MRSYDVRRCSRQSPELASGIYHEMNSVGSQSGDGANGRGKSHSLCLKVYSGHHQEIYIARM